MHTIDDYIKELESHYPNLLDSVDLAEIGIGSVSMLSKWRAAGQGPPFFKLGGNYKYLKADVISWLRSRYREQKEQNSCVN